MDETCEECGGRFDRPGLFGCNDKAHPEATLPQKIAAAIEKDLCDRRGLRHEWEQIEDEILCDIRDEWARIVAAKIEEAV